MTRTSIDMREADEREVDNEVGCNGIGKVDRVAKEELMRPTA